MSTTPGCDYGVSTDYRHCADCGTRRPEAELAPDATAEKLLVCRDREWCERQRDAVVQRALFRVVQGGLA